MKNADHRWQGSEASFNQTGTKALILTLAKRRDQYCRAYPYILQGTVKI